MPNKRVIVRGLPVEGPEVVLKRADISDLFALQIPSGQPIDLTGTGFAATPVAGRVVGAGPHTFVHTLPGGQHAVFMGGLCPRYTINNGARPIGVGRDWAAFLLGGQVVVYTLDEVYVHALAPEVGEVVGVAVSSLGGGQMLWLIAKGGSVVYVSIAADSHVGGGFVHAVDLQNSKAVAGIVTAGPGAAYIVVPDVNGFLWIYKITAVTVGSVLRFENGIVIPTFSPMHVKYTEPLDMEQVGGMYAGEDVIGFVIKILQANGDIIFGALILNVKNVQILIHLDVDAALRGHPAITHMSNVDEDPAVNLVLNLGQGVLGVFKVRQLEDGADFVCVAVKSAGPSDAVIALPPGAKSNPFAGPPPPADYDRLKALATRLVKQVASMKTELGGKVGALESERAAAAAQQAAHQADQQAAHLKALAAKEADHQKALADLKAAHRRAVADLKADLKAAHQKALADLKADHQKALAAHRSEIEGFRKGNQALEQEVLALKAANQKASEAEANLIGEVLALKAASRNASDELEAQRSEAFKELMAAFRKVDDANWETTLLNQKWRREQARNMELVDEMKAMRSCAAVPLPVTVCSGCINGGQQPFFERLKSRIFMLEQQLYC